MSSKNKLASSIVDELEEAGYDNVLLTAVNSKTGKAFTAINGASKAHLNALLEELQDKLHEVLEEEDEFDMENIPDEIKALMLALIMKKL